MADATTQGHGANGQESLREQISRAVGIALPGTAPANNEPGPTEAQAVLNEPIDRAVQQRTDIANWFGISDADMQGDFGNKLFSLPPAQLAAFHDDAKISYDKNGGKTPLTGDARDVALKSATAQAAAVGSRLEDSELGQVTIPGPNAEKTRATISEAFAAVDRENNPASSADPSSAPQTSTAAPSPAPDANTAAPHPAKPVAHRHHHHTAGTASHHAPRDRHNRVVETSSTLLTPQELEHHAAGLPTEVQYTTPVASRHGKELEISVNGGPGNTPTVFTVNSGSFHFQGNESDAHRAMRHLGMSDTEANAALSGEQIGDTNHVSVAAHLNGAVRDAVQNQRLADEAIIAARQKAAPAASSNPNSITVGGVTYTDDGKNVSPSAGASAQPPAIPSYLPSSQHPGYVDGDGDGSRAQGPYANIVPGASPVVYVPPTGGLAGLKAGGPILGVGVGAGVNGPVTIAGHPVTRPAGGGFHVKV